MTAIKRALEAGDAHALQVAVEGFVTEWAKQEAARRIDDQETDILVDHIGRTNPAAIDRMIAGTS